MAKQTTYKPNMGLGLGRPVQYTQVFSYLINHDKILLAKGGDGKLSLYLDGQGLDEHLGRVSAGLVQPYFTDHLGSVLNSTLGGSFQSYDAYGRTVGGLPIFATVFDSDPVMYGFAGRQFDLESGKYYNRARMYDPNTGRFLSQDPIGLRGGLNLYRYAHNRPVNRTDPTGTCDQIDSNDPFDLGYTGVPESQIPGFQATFDGSVSAFLTVNAGTGALGLALLAGPDAYLACALNAELCGSFAGGLLQGLTGSDSYEFSNDPYQNLATYLGEQTGVYINQNSSIDPSLYDPSYNYGGGSDNGGDGGGGGDAGGGDGS